MISGRRITPWKDRDGQPGDPDDVYGHWDDDPKGKFVEPSYVTYSDYSGSLVERSNLEEFIEQFAEHEDSEWWRVHGGHGTRGLIVRVDADERVPEIGEFFEGLENYPLANEERHSELEMEATNEAWTDYGFTEWEEGLTPLLPKLEVDPELDEDVRNQALTQFYYAMSDLYGQYPEVEDAAGSVAFHIDGIVKRLGEFVEDLNLAGEAGNSTQRAAAEEGTFGPAAFERLMEGALYGPTPDPRQFEYNGAIYRLLRGHHGLRYPPGKRQVFQDLMRERGLEAGLRFLEKSK